MEQGVNYIDKALEVVLMYDPSSPLLFSSGLFLFMFAGFMLFYSMLNRATMARIIYVLLFSLFFYYKTSGIYVLLLVGVSISDFVAGQLMAKSIDSLRRKKVLICSLAINLSVLAYFKYTNFFIEIFNGLAGSDFMDFKNIFLPVGISFFLFQSISYTVDIYKGRLKPLDNWLDYLFYLSFFPQLVAGPIVRASDFIPQIRQKPLVISHKMFMRGAMLILLGLVKKAVISDFISYHFVDKVFESPLYYTGFTNLMAIYGYALQIYCDFSGYSDMAIGIALLLGFRFNKNFDDPYKSATITEFWRRWHISLSSWLRDYLYISLGGNRKGRLRTYVNLMLTMLLGGLWHGAAMRFVLWGGLHGLALALHKFLMSLFPRLKTMGVNMKLPWRIAGVVLTFHIVCLGWLLFRAPDMQTCGLMLSSIFSDFGVDTIPQVLELFWATFVLMLFGYALHFIPSRVQQKAKEKFDNLTIYGLSAIFVIVIWIIMQLKSAEVQPFIYFQF